MCKNTEMEVDRVKLCSKKKTNKKQAKIEEAQDRITWRLKSRCADSK